MADLLGLGPLFPNVNPESLLELTIRHITNQNCEVVAVTQG